MTPSSNYQARQNLPREVMLLIKWLLLATNSDPRSISTRYSHGLNPFSAADRIPDDLKRRQISP